jgi:D-alanine--D-alanine ligase
LPLPAVVKPPRDGSSVGLSKVTAAEQWTEAVRLACAQDGAEEALAEVYIPGREWAVGVVNGKALPVIEIVAPGGWYDFQAKYAVGGSQHLYPEASDLTRKVQQIAEKAYAVTRCRGAVRVDFRVTDEGEAYILEINTAPGCTAMMRPTANSISTNSGSISSRSITAARSGRSSMSASVIPRFRARSRRPAEESGSTSAAGRSPVHGSSTSRVHGAPPATSAPTGSRSATSSTRVSI